MALFEGCGVLDSTSCHVESLANLGILRGGQRRLFLRAVSARCLQPHSSSVPAQLLEGRLQCLCKLSKNGAVPSFNEGADGYQ